MPSLAFHGRDQRQLGLYVLLAACGQNLGAQNLRQAGRLTEARKRWRQLIDGSWRPRFQALQQQARRQLTTAREEK
jgi:hypothetical protein